MPGPPPKPDHLRRRTNAMRGVTSLPAEGRQGEPPSWPLSGRAPKVWAELWAKPQAVAWERMGLARLVARYARFLLAAEKPGAPAMLLTEVRQMEDRLGLSPMALLRLRWEIPSDEVAQQRSGRDVSAPDDRRRRLTAVNDDA